ncbi:hypothetical protein SCT_1461 [Sulfuricella sp. T08]|nr:hypothetical protein SCT_1461 [Sulfuricella sp. T08]
MLSMAGPKGRGFRGCNAKGEQSPRHHQKQENPLRNQPVSLFYLSNWFGVPNQIPNQIPNMN